MGFFDKAKGLAQKAGAAIDKYDQNKLARDKNREQALSQRNKNLSAQIAAEKKQQELNKLRYGGNNMGMGIGFGGSTMGPTKSYSFGNGGSEKGYNVGFGAYSGGKAPSPAAQVAKHAKPKRKSQNIVVVIKKR